MFTATKTAPKSLSMSQIMDKAKSLGINPAGLKKTELIHSIQRAEKNTPCFGTSNGSCQYANCCFMADCLKIKK